MFLFKFLDTVTGGDVAVQQVLQPRPIKMLFDYTLQTIAPFLPLAAAQSCWRNTACETRTASFNGPWDSYMYSPVARTVSPANILFPNHTVLSSYPGDANLPSNGSLLIFDFGKEVGGIVTITYTANGTGDLGLAFSEARNWTGEASDGSNGSYNPGGDGALLIPVLDSELGIYTVPDLSLRGGFRYLSIFMTTDSVIDVNITAVTLEIAFQPTWPDLRAYGGYFYSNDDLINKIWYAGAYTLQTNAIPPKTGRVYPLLSQGWENDAYLGTNGSSIFVDGAKRDRATWSGDLGVALPSVFVSTGDFESAKNALQLQYDLQQASGELPMAGPPLNFYSSDTYHMHSIIGTYEYVLHSGDMTFLTTNWAGITSAVNFIAAKIDNTGLLYVTGTADWGRLNQGGYNTAANALLYRSLIIGIEMANWANDTTSIPTWTAQAAALKAAINKPSSNWDPRVGAYKDNPTSTIYPQDGNSLALYYNMSTPSSAPNISAHLTTTWTALGASCPELPNNIVPFPSSLELKAHLRARHPSRALALMRRSWGWYLTNPYGTLSTFPEGYLVDGSWGYRGAAGYQGDSSYTSHSHGWSTGPTHVLSTMVLGLRLLTPGGGEWVLEPQCGDLESVEGGYTTPLGKFSAGWVRGKGFFSLWYDVPAGTSGTLILPAAAAGSANITIDTQPSTAFTHDSSKQSLTIKNQSGGKHSLIVS